MKTSDAMRKWSEAATLNGTAKVVRVNMTIPRETLVAFKAWCEREGVTVSGMVAEMMAREVG